MFKDNPLKENNRVIIRVWATKGNQDFPVSHNIGHVSIETTAPAKYMSFWPIPFTHEQYSKYKASNSLEQRIWKYFLRRNKPFMRSGSVTRL